ncbi:MAG: hypothetical protein WAZ94_13305 [Phycisphaerales bacterium]
MTTLQVPIELISLGDNHRLKESIDPESLKTLADSIAVDGLRQPVLLHLSADGATFDVVRNAKTTEEQLAAVRTLLEIRGNGGTPFELVFGRRRMAAHELLRLTEVRAEVLVTRLPEREASRLRAVENLQRADLTPLEEAVVVSQQAEAVRASLGGRDLTPAEVVSRVAEDLGRNPRWVRDRIFLTRLGEVGRRMLTQKLLTLGAARRLCDLADPRVGDQILKSLLGYMNPTPEKPIGLASIGGDVAQRLMSLATVPWKLDVEYAGKPACVSCPHNSANTPDLFEDVDRSNRGDSVAGVLGEATEAGSSVCTFHSCFEHKEKRALDDLEKARERVAKMADRENDKIRAGQIKAPTGEQVIEAAKHQVPEGLKSDEAAASIAAVIDAKLRAARDAQAAGAKSKASGGNKSGAKAGAKPGSKANADPKKDAMFKWKAAVGEYRRSLEDRIEKLASKKPGVLSMLMLTQDRPWFTAVSRTSEGATLKPELRKKVAADMKHIAKVTLAGLATFEKTACARDLLDSFFFDGHEDLFAMTLKAMGGEVPRCPELGDFMPKGKSVVQAKRKKR